jgi:bacterioferritin-associated ferredoxin
MYICICHNVTDTQVETAIDNGSTSMKQLSDELKIGSQCGKCCQCTKRILNKKLVQIAIQEREVA